MMITSEMDRVGVGFTLSIEKDLALPNDGNRSAGILPASGNI
ncbi:hypothetical protein [Egbenema bharatensis]